MGVVRVVVVVMDAVEIGVGVERGAMGMDAGRM